MEQGLTSKGFLGRAAVRLLLLFIVLSEVTFLATRYRVRADLTGDQLYTLTSSTRLVLGKLEDLLLIEAYFSPKQNLPILDQPKRMALVNLLEEYEKLGSGKVRVQYIDPLENKTKRETAERLGMVPQHATVQGAGGVTAVDIWQGLRLRYGGRKQEVIPYLGFPPRGQHSTAHYERFLTPMIKRLTVTERPKIGVLAFSSRPGGRGGISLTPESKTPPQHFNHLMRIFEREYDLRPLDISKGQLIPADIQTALLVRPKYLTDRTKFVFDQFLMRGGKLVVFADTCEVEVRDDRALRGTVVPYDAANAKYRFQDVLKFYGADVRNQIVGDGVNQLQELFYDIRQDQRTGQQVPQMIFYPYMFRAADDNWHELVEIMATGSNGQKDPALAAQYKQQVQPGMNTDHELVKVLRNVGAPGMFWPCPVGLTEELPAGVTGEVLLRSSPLSWTEQPNMPLDPFDEAPQFQHREQNRINWMRNKAQMRPRLPRQFPLMVHLRGTFGSFFADKEVPAAPTDQPAKQPAEDDDWGAKDKPKKDTALPNKPDPAKPKAAPEAKLTKAPAEASLLVIGDATFIRDDFLAGVYTQPTNQPNMLPLVGPHARNPRSAVLFLKNLLDWLAQERDLNALQNKVRTDRTMKFGEQNVAQQETLDEFRDRVISKTSLVQWVNAVLPAALLLLCGILVWLTRRSKKRAFLASL